MDKKIVLGVITLVVVSISLLLMVPENKPDSPDMLPWKISHPSADTTRAFGVTLGATSLTDTDRQFGEVAEVSLFKTSEGKMQIEAFYDELNFNGIKAKFVLNVAVPNEELPGMFQRGLRLNSTPSGKRVTLAFDDLARVHQAPVLSITYLPTARLEDGLFLKRFGSPEQRIKEKKSGAIHWIYPRLGLDITLGGSEKAVLQYISPKDFDLVKAPLLSLGEVLP